MNNLTNSTKFTQEQISKIQKDFVQRFYEGDRKAANGKKLTKAEFAQIVKKHLSIEFFNS